jgi:hypothetical protein
VVVTEVLEELVGTVMVEVELVVEDDVTFGGSKPLL